MAMTDAPPVDVLAAQVREEVSHIARGCRSGLSHNPAVHEQAIDAALDALVGCVTAAEQRADTAYERMDREATEAMNANLRAARAEAALADARNALARIAAAGEGVPDWRSMADLAREALARLDGGRDE